MLLSLGSGTFCQAPTLPHPSRGSGSNCPTRWPQLSDKVVIIVQQRLFCRTIYTTFQQKYRLVPFLQKGVSNSPNGQNLSGNVDLQINLLYYSLSVSFKHILLCLNQYLDAGNKKIDIDTGKIKSFGICKKKVRNLICWWSYHSDLL